MTDSALTAENVVAKRAAAKALQTAVKATRKKLPILGTKVLNSSLDHFCGDFADAYRVGAEEAQGEILERLAQLQRAL